MIDLNQKQKDIIQNKKDHKWVIGDINHEFCLMYGEVAEAYDAYNKKMGKEEMGLELADVAIYLLGISEMMGISLEEEIEKKMQINKNRVYKFIDGEYRKVSSGENK